MRLERIFELIYVHNDLFLNYTIGNVQNYISDIYFDRVLIKNKIQSSGPKNSKKIDIFNEFETNYNNLHISRI